ncbi:MAG TPA: putative sulfate exporter family transporter [Fimbriimonas sp.]|nr:putative sulfate exporter family transporter [Fimbriimonas sp.]
MAAFFILAVGCLYPLLSPPESQIAFVPPAALIAGILLALTLGNPYPNESKKVSKTLLQAAVVLLGFSMDLQKILDAGLQGLAFALASITSVFVLGYGLQKVLKVRPLTALLVSTGTAICGGSAIAAMSSVTDAPQEDVSVAVGTVFLLNAVALVLFPPLGHAIGLSPDQFGIWAGIAIHDVSSVVGAATAYGGGSLETATAVKLSRVLYLVPIVLLTAFWLNRAPDAQGPTTNVQRPPIPWFIFLFLLASLLRTAFPPIQTLAPSIKLVAVSGFSLSLFLIGAGITLKTLKNVGIRPLLLGVVLWAFMSVAALFAARQT